MDKLFSPLTVQRIIKKYDFKLEKSLGQNFLIDKNIIEKIIRALDIQKEDLLIEIGPGIGTLTSAVADYAGKVKAIEIDKNLIPILEETLSEYENVEIIHNDILKTDLRQLILEEKKLKQVKVLGNLPYYITTAIIMKILKERNRISDIVIMIQKEVADRIKAFPGNKDYGSLSIAVQYLCDVEQVASVPKNVFIPKPKVDSSVIHLKIRPEPPVHVLDEDFFYKVVRAAFGQRRKTLLNSLSSNMNINKEILKEVLLFCKIDPARRAETLTIEEFAILANHLNQK